MTVDYETHIIVVPYGALIVGVVVAHIALATLATVLKSGKSEGRGSKISLAAVWLIPVIGPMVSLWHFRSVRQPPLL